MDWGCWWSCLRVRPANSGRCPHQSTSARVERAGLKSAMWAKATRLAGLALLMATAATWAVAVLGGCMSDSHSLVVGIWWPCKMMMLWCLTVMWSAVNTMSQPASHDCPMESKGWVARCRTMWPCCATGRNPGRARSTLCVEWRMVPDGVCIWIESSAGHLLQTRVELEKKWAMQLESVMA